MYNYVFADIITLTFHLQNSVIASFLKLLTFNNLAKILTYHQQQSTVKITFSNNKKSLLEILVSPWTTHN